MRLVAAVNRAAESDGSKQQQQQQQQRCILGSERRRPGQESSVAVAGAKPRSSSRGAHTQLVRQQCNPIIHSFPIS